MISRFANGDRPMVRKFSPSFLLTADISPTGNPSGYLSPKPEVMTASPLSAFEFVGIDLISK